MSIVFLIGTLAFIAFFYWMAYQNEKLMGTIEISGNLLLNIPEIIFKLVLIGLCMGLISSLDTPHPEKYIGWPSANPGLDLLVGAVIGLAVQFVVNITSILAIRIFGKEIYSPALMKSIVPKKPIEWVLILIPLFIAVLFEELLFRAMLIGGFSLVVNPWVMAVASSVIFGIMHAPQGRLGIVMTTLVGLVFGAVFILTNSLVTVIAAHYVVNFLQILRAKEDLSWFERFQKPTPKAATAFAPETEKAAVGTTTEEPRQS
jgi:membrane protease YdiL (CAAX protease family)